MFTSSLTKLASLKANTYDWFCFKKKGSDHFPVVYFFVSVPYSQIISYQIFESENTLSVNIQSICVEASDFRSPQ